MREDAYSFSPLRSVNAKKELDAILFQLKECLNDEATAKSSMGCSCLVGCEVVSSSSVKLLTFCGVGEVLVPTWQCRNTDCLKVYNPRPMQHGYFPSTPKVPSYWIDQRMLDLHMDLGPCHGLSFRGGQENFMFDYTH